MTVQTPENHPKSYLTLSAAQELDSPSDRSAAERFEDLLELRDLAIARGLHSLADWYADRIVDEMTAGAAR
jgi:hypothetical protein